MQTLPDWTERPAPRPSFLPGRMVNLEVFDAEAHSEALWQALGGDGPDGANHTISFFPDAPYENAKHFGDGYAAKQAEWHTMVMCDTQFGLVRGMATYMRIRPEHGSVEVGAVAHGHAIQKTPIATEAHYLLARHIFDDLGYRRYEWKLNDANAASHAAARRMGFTYEGTFRKDMITAGKNRDTAWYSMLDEEWPSRKTAFEAWLDPSNFDPSGNQKKGLAAIRDTLENA